MSYRITVNNSYEISLTDFINWSGLSEYVVIMLAKQSVYQIMPDGSKVTFEYYE